MTKLNRLLRLSAAVGAVWLAASSIAKAADFLMIPDSNRDRILLFDPNDGSLVNDNFIDGSDLFSTPLNAIQVNEEIWVSLSLYPNRASSWGFSC